MSTRNLSAELGVEAPAHGAPAQPYQVVARRYRPQNFGNLVGQNHITQALTNAIATNRVGHAYMFTGARGTGKTSTARIFAKALCCEKGPSGSPCNACDICQSISQGQDIDIIEIDGASNNGVDEIRELRANVSSRPSRARFKIYIIDEVHMLSKPAFNALLKTLEEPPSHVKFLFCTTDPEKVPITVLSRCQRFDFAPVEAGAIVNTLAEIVLQEKRQADREALELIARRAAGSMRDSQSLLEQLLAFGGEHITVADVHRMLGSAPSGRLAALVDHLLARNAAGALAEVHDALGEGVEAGQLAEQLLGYFRDLMAVAVGCEAPLLLHAAASEHGPLAARAQALGLETILAMLQILDQTLVRMAKSIHPRTLVEIGVVRICSLENLEDLSSLIAQVSAAAISAAPGTNRPLSGPVPPRPMPAVPNRAEADQKKTERAPPPNGDLSAAAEADHSIAPAERPPLTASSVAELWQQLVGQLEDMSADFARKASRIAILAPNRLVATIPDRYTKSMLELPTRKQQLEDILFQLSGQRIVLAFELGEVALAAPAAAPPPTPRQRTHQAAQHPLVRLAVDVFQAEILRTDQPRAKAVVAPTEPTTE